MKRTGFCSHIILPGVQPSNTFIRLYRFIAPVENKSKFQKFVNTFRGQEQHVVVENGGERAEGGESESELDLLAEVETESDSDDQDNAESAQRSVQTGATQGSDAGKTCQFGEM